MTTTLATRPLSLPSAPVLVGGTYAATVLASITYTLGRIAFTDVDPYEKYGPVDSIIDVGIFGTAALALAVAIGLALRGSPERNRTAAIVLAALLVPAIIAWWSGAPAVVGAAAAWKAGMTKGSTPLGGFARIAGLVGLFIAIACFVLMVLEQALL